MWEVFMDNSMATSWWKLMAGGTALAVFNIFAYRHLDSARGPVMVWAPVKLLYGAFGPQRVMTVLAALAVLFMLAALVEKVRRRENEDDFDRPIDRNNGPREPGQFRWVDVD
jgi:hypothetical protein